MTGRDMPFLHPKGDGILYSARQLPSSTDLPWLALEDVRVEAREFSEEPSLRQGLLNT